MKSFVVFFAVVAVAVADVSHLRGSEADAQIVLQDTDVRADGFNYNVQTSNGINAQASGLLKAISPSESALVVQGQNSHTAPGGELIQLTYTADENGYHAQGAHLPTPPPPQPIPEYILRALAYIEAHPAIENVPQRRL